MNLLMKGAALAPPFSCTTKYSSDVYSPRPPDIRVRLLPTKPPVHFTTEQPGRDTMSLRQYEMTCLTKKAGSIWLCRRLPPAFLCVFCNCVCPPSPWSIYADSPTEIFPRGCYISIFYIQLSAFHLPTQFVLLLLLDCDIFKLSTIFNLYLFGV